MSGARRRLGRWIVRTLVRPSLSPSLSPAARRRRLETIARFQLPTRGVRVEPAHLGGLPGEWVLPRGAAADLAGLYVHGGGFITGSPRTHRAAASALAAAAGMDLFVVDYRLAPECPFPGARDDVLAAWRDLEGRSHIRAGVIAGDSAGGGLALAATLALARTGEPVPAALALFSPFLDLTLEGLKGRRDDDLMLPQSFIRESAAAYRGDRPAGDPEVSPLLGDLSGLPPTFVCVDADEALAGDGRRLATACPAAVNLVEKEGLWHDWPLFAGIVPEADATLGLAGRHLADHARRAAG